MMKKRIYALLTCYLLLFLTACGNEPAGRTGDSGSEDTAQIEETVSSDLEENGGDEEESAEELTLEQGEVRIAYVHNNTLVLAFHGPYKDIGMSFRNKDGSQLEEELFSAYGDMNPGWTLAISYKISEKYPVENLALEVSDYRAPRNEDGTYATRLFTDFGELMTDQERRDIGFDFLDGRCCLFSLCRGTYGSDNFGLHFGITWFCDNYDQETGEIDIPNFKDKFAFFTGNGTPLEEAYEGYTLQTELNWGTFWAQLYSSSSQDNTEEHHQMTDQLIENNPYVIYTNDDGTTQTFQLR